MTEPTGEEQSPLRNPPNTRRRGRGARIPRSTPLPATPEPGEAPPAEPAGKKKDRKPHRSRVCPSCGKYHDITDRAVGSEFECKCGQVIVVPPLKENPVARPPEITLRLQELRSRRTFSLVALVIGFAACILLLSAMLYLLVTERRYIQGTCTGLAALGFLVVAVVATSEWRRANAEIAAEETDNP